MLFMKSRLSEESRGRSSDSVSLASVAPLPYPSSLDSQGPRVCLENDASKCCFGPPLSWPSAPLNNVDKSGIDGSASADVLRASSGVK